ncbi:MAG: hypothetical protein Q9163_000300 [Psora crenata]
MTRGVIGDSDDEDERGATPNFGEEKSEEDVPELDYSPTTMISSASIMPGVTSTGVPNSHKMMSASQQLNLAPASTSKINSRRALTSIGKPKSLKAVKPMGSKEIDLLQEGNDVFEFTGHSDGELSSPRTRKVQRYIDAIDQDRAVLLPFAIAEASCFQGDIPAPSLKPYIKAQSPHSEANNIATRPDSTPLVDPSLTKTPPGARCVEYRGQSHPSFPDALKFSSHGKTDEGKSPKEYPEARAAPQPAANPVEADCLLQRNQLTSSPYLISPSRSTTARKALTTDSELGKAHNPGKGALNSSHASLYTAESAGSSVLMADLMPNAPSCEEVSCPPSPKGLNEPREAPVSRKRKRQDDDQVDELGSDEINIALPKEQYQPRPSKSRGSRNERELVIPEDYSKRPEVLTKSKRKSKRCKTTAFQELIPKGQEKEEDDDNDGTPVCENRDLKIPEFAKHVKAQDQVREEQTGHIERQSEDAEPIHKVTPPKKQRGRPKKDPEGWPVPDVIEEFDKLDPSAPKRSRSPEAQNSKRRGRPPKRCLRMDNGGSDNETDADVGNLGRSSQGDAPGTVYGQTTHNRVTPGPPEEAAEALSPATKPVPPPTTPQQSPAVLVKGPDKHSPLGSGKIAYRVGLSKKARIEPLLRILRK